MRFTVHQYKATDDDLSEADAKAMAAAMLREKCHDAGLVMQGGVTKGEPEPVVVNADLSGWTPAGVLREPTGYVIEWSCESAEPIRDPDPLPGGRWVTAGDDQRRYEVEIPDDDRFLPVHGGPVRVLHGLGGPVTITATMRDGYTGDGILVATPITDDEEHVELFPGVAALRVVRDPEPED